MTSLVGVRNGNLRVMSPYTAMKETLLKMAAAKHRFSVSQTRSGRRSMSVDTMLRKEKDGTLYKTAVVGADGGTGGSSVPFPDEGIRGTRLRPPRKKGEAPTRWDNAELVDRIDGRGQVYTQVSPSTEVTNIGFNNSGA